MEITANVFMASQSFSIVAKNVCDLSIFGTIPGMIVTVPRHQGGL
jgi:hypothetical protein